LRSAPITPLTLPRKVRHLLVYGGSFDPPHFYHTIAPLSVVGRIYDGDAWVLYVPAARSPHKSRGPFASDEHRLEMLKLALDTPGPRSIWTDEIDRARWEREHGRAGGPSYMIDTLRRLKRVLPRENITLRLLIGSDQVAEFHRWKEPRKVIALAEPLVLVRSSGQRKSGGRGARAWRPTSRWTRPPPACVKASPAPLPIRKSGRIAKG
jgi:nicotinate-nucleotide adenylyltransferase